ncbi:MAG: hypothetical protein LBH03_01890 [Holophagales bacterium]|jgi:hypothetical protein|nr:hypothetical protein [Holophagales bacterium]
MPQISLDIQDSLADRLQVAAIQRKSTISTLIISIIDEKLNERDEAERKKNYALEKTQGSFKDEPLSKPPDIPWEADVPRRFDLL